MFGNPQGAEGSPEHALPPFLREVIHLRGVQVMRVQGPIDASIAPQVEAIVKAEEASNPNPFTRPLLFDLKDATCCDFATVAFLVQALQRRVKSGVGVGIVNPPAALVAELQIAKLDDMFRVYEDEDRALAALATPGFV